MYILALDQGTTSSRAIVFDRSGRVISVAQREFRQLYPQPGWVEHDPIEIWETQRDVAIEAVAMARIDRKAIAAIGITNQRETTVVWERRSGQPIMNAIVWQDRRTAELCTKLREAGVEEEITRRTGLVLDPYFSGTKLSWILEHFPGVREGSKRGELAFGTVDSWLLWNLTGGAVHATDATNASRTLLYDIDEHRWSERLCGLLGVPMQLLPEIRDTTAHFGTSDILGFPVPIHAMAGDQHAALFGQLCLEKGTAKNTYGTGCFLLLNCGAERAVSKSRLLSTLAWRRDGVTTYALEGSVFVAGSAVQWLRDGLGIISRAEEVQVLAASVPDSGGVTFVPAFTGLGAPHWDPAARGTILGITRGTTKGHLARATLEAIAHGVSDVVDAMSADTGAPLRELKVDGGAAANDLLMQMQADLLGVPVVRPAMTESTALGAAYLAGLGAGIWSDPSELEANWTVDRRFEPQISAAEAGSRKARWSEAVARSRAWA